MSHGNSWLAAFCLYHERIQFRAPTSSINYHYQLASTNHSNNKVIAAKKLNYEFNFYLSVKMSNSLVEAWSPTGCANEDPNSLQGKNLTQQQAMRTEKGTGTDRKPLG